MSDNESKRAVSFSFSESCIIRQNLKPRIKPELWVSYFGQGFIFVQPSQGLHPRQVANLTLWGSRFFLPAFFIDFYFITLTHVAAHPCGSSHFSAQNAASPYGLPLLSAKSHARLGCSVASALAHASLSLPTFRG